MVTALVKDSWVTVLHSTLTDCGTQTQRLIGPKYCGLTDGLVKAAILADLRVGVSSRIVVLLDRVDRNFTSLSTLSVLSNGVSFSTLFSKVLWETTFPGVVDCAGFLARLREEDRLLARPRLLLRLLLRLLPRVPALLGDLEDCKRRKSFQKHSL